MTPADPHTSRDARAALRRLARTARRRATLRRALGSCGMLMPVAVAFAAAFGASPAVLAAVAAGALALSGLSAWASVRRDGLGLEDAARHLDRTVPAVEESATLLLRPEDGLTLLERLQRRRVIAALHRLDELPAPAARLRWPATAAAVGAVSAVGAAVLLPLEAPVSDDATSPVTFARADAADAAAPVEVEDAALTVTPPGYTGLARFVADGLDAEAPAASVLRWRLRTTRAPHTAYVVTADGDSIRFLPSEDDARTLSATHRLDTSALYHLSVTGSDGRTRRTDLHRLTALGDRAPLVTLRRPALRTRVGLADDPRVTVAVTAEDDYGLAGARLVATVTKGSGENVKFREEALPFDVTDRNSRRLWTLKTVLHLDSLGLVPGDELYFYVEATDRHAPDPQTGRSETAFVVLPDTSAQATAFGAGLAVDNELVYLRSQRQIIIDTEKLIAARPDLDADEVQERANDLGIDQKILRLRYGQFLGEEFESGYGGPSPNAHGDHDHDGDGEPDHAAEEHEDAEHGEDHDDEGHDHEGDDHDDGEEAVRDRINLNEHAGHDHGGSEGAGDAPSGGFGGDPASVVAPFAHAHDSREGATFYSDDIKRELRVVLQQMWEAELRLRTGRLRDALPFENEALRRLKALQQKSRIYVKRVGFEPPPLEPAETRLSGDLDDVRRPRVRRTVTPERPWPALRAALPVLHTLRRTSTQPLAPAQVAALDAAGAELARAALDAPGQHLGGLSALRRLLDAARDASAAPPAPDDVRADVAAAVQAIWRVLPPADPAPAPRAQAAAEDDPLGDAYFEALEGAE